MRQRGRPRKDERAIKVIEGGFGQRRPEASDDLTDRQQVIWRETVASEPADYFNTNALRNMLKDYCRHCQAGEAISEIINSFQPEWLKNAEGAKRYHSLLKMRDLETRAAATLATKLRLTNQSRYTPGAAATASRNTLQGNKPWDE